MAQVIYQQNQTPELLQHFVDQYVQEQQAKDQAQSEDDFRQKQIGIQQQQVDQTGKYQTGQLDVQNKQLSQQQQIQSAKTLLDGWQARMNEGDPTVAQEAQQYITDHPEMKPYLQTAAMYHATQGQQAQGVAQGIHLQNNTDLKNGSTDPNKLNVYTHDVTNSFMPAEGFKQAQAADLATQDQQGNAPDLSARNPAPSGNAVPDFEARATGALTTAPENQTAQTQVQTEGMRLNADAPYRAAMTREATAKALIAEGQQKMMSGDSTAPNSYAAGVLQNPRSFKSLTPPEKHMATMGLGGRAPVELGQTEEAAYDAAQNTMDGVKRAAAILDKWRQQGNPITGPMIGRYNSATNQWGDSILPSNLPPEKLAELQGDIAALQQNLGINKLNELHAVIGGRVPAQMAQIIAAPNIAQNPDMLNGALLGMYDIAKGRVAQLDHKIWNGAPPQLGSQSQQATPQQGATVLHYVPGKGLMVPAPQIGNPSP